MQLTGFSDPVYAEAYVNVHQYNILLGNTLFTLIEVIKIYVAVF